MADVEGILVDSRRRVKQAIRSIPSIRCKGYISMPAIEEHIFAYQLSDRIKKIAPIDMIETDNDGVERGVFC